MKIAIGVSVALILCIGGFSYWMYQRDMHSLENFVAAYEEFDRTPSETTLLPLKATASARISSLIKNDRDAMDTMKKIADLATQELAATGNTKESLTLERKSNYEHFRNLGK